MIDNPLFSALLENATEQEKKQVEDSIAKLAVEIVPSSDSSMHFTMKLVAKDGNVYYAYSTDGLMILRVVHVKPNGSFVVTSLDTFMIDEDIVKIDYDFTPMTIDWDDEQSRNQLVSEHVSTETPIDVPTEGVATKSEQPEVDICKDEVIAPICETEVEGLLTTQSAINDSETAFDEMTSAGTTDVIITETTDGEEEITETDESRPYIPASQACKVLETIVPNSMRFEIFKALQLLDEQVNGVDDFVAKKLRFITDDMDESTRKQGWLNFCEALASEQVDGVALGIYNIESKEQSIIIADQTGIGKGRQAASIVRYAHFNNQPKTPVFITEKPNLFSDIYRDMIDIESDAGIPFYTYEGEQEISFDKFIRTHGKDVDMDDIQEMYTQENITEPIYEKNKNYNKDVKGKTRMIPFILNGSSDKAQIKDSDKNIIYKGSSKAVSTLKSIYNKNKKDSLERRALVTEFLSSYNVVLATYSQFNKAGWKQDFLTDIASGNILVLDESHTAGGSSGGAVSNTSKFFRELLVEVKGVCFLSATFSKTPNNMPIYAEKTSIKEAGLEESVMIKAFKHGGTALQEIVSSQLTAEGQLIRREKSFKDVKTTYTYLDESQKDSNREKYNLKTKHAQISDNIMDMYRKILDFQREHIDPLLSNWNSEISDFIEVLTSENPESLKASSFGGYSDEELQKLIEDHKLANEGKNSEWNKISQQPVTASFFNFYNQMLFALKSEAVADMAIDYMENGRKPFIAIANTMEAFLSNMKNADGRVYEINEEIPFDFNMVLLSILEKTLYYVERDTRLWDSYGDTLPQKLIGNRKRLNLASDISLDAENKFQSLKNEILSNKIGIPNSPIDYVLHRIRQSGFIVEEITGRSLKLEVLSNNKAIIRKNKLKTVNIAYSEFNRNQIDCVVVNQVGAVGASAQAVEVTNANGDKIVKFIPKYNAEGKIIPPNSLQPTDEVKQRVMLVLQAELDINKEVQKRGRINRTGQVYNPEYEYISTSIPAEQRIMMMLQRKMKSLDANTTGNQKQSKSIINIKQANQEDFLNKYGDDVVYEWIESDIDNIELNDSIGSPINIDEDKKGKKAPINTAHKFTGKIGIATVEAQERFYEEINPLYREEIAFLKALGEYDLEVEKLDLEVETVDRLPAIIGKGGASVFGKDSILEKVEMNSIKKPYTLLKIQESVKSALVLNGNPVSAVEYNEFYVNKMTSQQELLISNSIQEVKNFYNGKIENVINDAEVKKKQTSIDDKIQKALLKIEQIKLDDSLSDTVKQTKIQGLLNKNIETEANRESDLEQKMESRIIEFQERIESQSKNIRDRFESNANRIKRTMDRFPIGKPFYFPAIDYKDSKHSDLAVCIGYNFTNRDDNPFVPSKVRASFAIASAQVSLDIPLSKEQFDNDGDIQKSADSKYADYDFLDRWDDIVAKYTGRISGYIVTGNILQAMGNQYLRNGRLVKYTLIGGGIKEGILLPPKFDPFSKEFRDKLKVSVPLSKAREILETLNEGERVELVDFKSNLHSYSIERHFTGDYVFTWESPLLVGKRAVAKQDIQLDAQSDKGLFALTDTIGSDGEVENRGSILSEDGSRQFISNQKHLQLRFPSANISKLIDYGIENYDWRLMVTFTQFNKIKEGIELNIDADSEEDIARLFGLLFIKEKEYEERLQLQREAARGDAVEEVVKVEGEVVTDSEVNNLIEQNEANKELLSKQQALKGLIKFTDLIEITAQEEKFKKGGLASATPLVVVSPPPKKKEHQPEINEVVIAETVVKKSPRRKEVYIPKGELSDKHKAELASLATFMDLDEVNEMIVQLYPKNRRKAAMAFAAEVKEAQ